MSCGFLAWAPRRIGIAVTPEKGNVEDRSDFWREGTSRSHMAHASQVVNTLFSEYIWVCGFGDACGILSCRLCFLSRR